MGDDDGGLGGTDGGLGGTDGGLGGSAADGMSAAADPTSDPASDPTVTPASDPGAGAAPTGDAAAAASDPVTGAAPAGVTSATPVAAGSSPGSDPSGGAGLFGGTGLTGAPGDGFSIQPAAVSSVTGTMSGLLSNGTGVADDLGSLALDPMAFAGIGSAVASGSAAMQANQLSAATNVLGLLGNVNGLIDTSSQGYQQADQSIAQAFGGNLATAGTDPTAGTAPTAATDPAASTQSTADQTAQTAQTAQTGSLADDPAMQQQLIDHEGARQHVYTDTQGHPTVGIGFNLDRPGAADALSAVGADYDSVRNGTQDLTDSQISQLAQTDTQHAVDVARGYFSGFDQLDPARQRALTDMTFNLDNKINQFTGLHTALTNGDYNAAAASISNSLFARQTGQRGVDLANQMRTGGQ